ncbi:hypothetical protein FB451DRAFT_1258987 [Mycena latifolia]|nr:hypothetical protein FB451DRAFT_1258987 [Mycena latifolia]
MWASRMNARCLLRVLLDHGVALINLLLPRAASIANRAGDIGNWAMGTAEFEHFEPRTRAVLEWCAHYRLAT